MCVCFQSRSASARTRSVQLAVCKDPYVGRIHFIRFLFFVSWQKLLGDSTERKQRLLRMQEQFRQIEELYLTFAKKASAFNSWFENAEEDLTDPVRCNSIEEIRALRDAHAQFQVPWLAVRITDTI